MAAKEFAVFVRSHLDGLRHLHQMHAGLEGQFGELSSILATFDAEAEKTMGDTHLSPVGRWARLRTARDAATAAVESWKNRRVDGVRAQANAQRESLRVRAESALARPSEAQVRQMAERLAAFDALEIEALYASATDAEQLLVEAAAEFVGRVPRRVGDSFVWQHVLAPERIAETRAARLASVYPEGAAAVRDLETIQKAYEGLAGAATVLLRDSVPAHLEPVPTS